jgi:beta-lactamase regulating signal transducer with metallopeptidase domain
MKILSEVISQNVITALGWNLFHIIWQGILVMALLSFILRLLSGKSSQIRYIISLFSLFIMLGLAIFNFTKHYEKETIENSVVEISERSQHQAPVLIDLNQSNIKFTSRELIQVVKERIENIDRYFPLIVSIWILGIFIFIVKIVLSYIFTVRLKSVGTRVLSADWLDKFQKLQKQLKIKRAVNYLESKLVKVPIVLGHLKPVIVIPVEMITGIPTNQIEAIIAHELAHIRRNDYIFNVLQTIIETMFFFHPAVWYISSQIRKERENCCDDIALTVCEGSLIYAKALVSVQEFSLNRLYSAVAFSGRKKHLLNRIKRMIMKPQNKSNFTDKIIAAIIILSATLALSFTNRADISNYISDKGITIPSELKEMESLSVIIAPGVPDLPVIPNLPTRIDTVKRSKHYHNEIDIKNNTVIRTYNDQGHKKKIEFTLKNGKVTELYVDDKKIPETDYHKYQKEIDETIGDLKDAKVDIREAMKDIEELDVEKIQMEIQEAMKDVHFDMAEAQEEIARAIEEAHEIDVEDILKEVEMSISNLKDLDIDFDFDGLDIEIGDIHIDMQEIREEMEQARESIRENIDLAEIQKEMLKVQEELSKIDHEKIRMQMEEEIKSFEQHDKEKVIEELEEKLEELEALELEEK